MHLLVRIGRRVARSILFVMDARARSIDDEGPYGDR